MNMVARIASLVETEITKLVRQSFFYVMLVIVSGACLLSVAISQWNYHPENTVDIFSGQACFLQAVSQGLFVSSYLLLIWSALTISQESGTGFYRMLFAKPVSRFEFFSAKTLTVLLLLLFMFWLVSTLSYFASGLLFGYGDILDLSENPPILQLSQADMSGYMIRGIALSFLPLFALCVFGLLCSTITDKGGIAVGTAVGSYVMLDLVKQAISDYRHLLWTSYVPPLNFSDIEPISPMLIARDYSRGFAPKWDVDMIAYSIGVPVIFAAVFFITAAIIFSRKDMVQ